MIKWVYKSALVVLLVLSWPLRAGDEILVRLQTVTPMLPVYVAQIEVGDTSQSKLYIENLERVLRFDFDHNGRTQVLPFTEQKEALAKKVKTPGGFEPSSWKSLGVLYLITTRLERQQLIAELFCVNTQSAKQLEPIRLSGKVQEDRRAVHRLSDAIHQEMLGTEGIASTKILYTLRSQFDPKDPNKAVAEVWESDYDGHNARQLTFDHSYCVSPVYVPVKSGYVPGSFMYVSYRQGQSKIFASKLSGSDSQRVVTLGGNQLMPAISPQRNLLAFVSDISGRADLFIQPFNAETGIVGKPRQVFSAPKSTQASPSFHPDGNQVVFVSNKDGTPRLYILQVDQVTGEPIGKPRLISKVNRENTAPAWSPDGSKIAYSAMTEGVRQIWIYDCLKQSEWQLTQGPGHKENPAWAQNSLHLVFNSAEGASSELYLVNLNQPKARKITAGPGEKRFPSWQ